jgi:hypothetical protein
MAAYFLSDRDRAIIENLLRQHRAGPQTPPRWPSEQYNQTPDVFIAKPLTDTGIPALERGIGTGYDLPGYAECKIYKIVWEYGSGPQLQPIANATFQVYNVLANDLEQDWIIVQRTKQGFWVATPTATFTSFLWGKLDDELGWGIPGTGSGSSPGEETSPGDLQWMPSATMSIWSTDWSEDTGEDITVVIPPDFPSTGDAYIPAGAWVRAVKRADGVYYVDHALVAISVVTDVDIVENQGISYLARQHTTAIVFAVGSTANWTNIIELTTCGTGTGTGTGTAA